MSASIIVQDASNTTIIEQGPSPTTNAADITSGTLALARGGTGASLTDPNADRILFWDDSAGAMTFLTIGTGLSITGTTLNGMAASAWGSVTGTLSDQTDLQSALNLKANSSSLATVATTGAYSDLSGAPSIPTAANPTAAGVGLTAINGSAATFMRSDGAPALDVSIAPTWTGQHTFASGAITTSKPISITQTWNSGGVAFNPLLVNVTDTASAAASLLVDLQVAGSSKFKVTKAGNATIAGTLTIGAGSLQDFGSGQIGVNFQYYLAVGGFGITSVPIQFGTSFGIYDAYLRRAAAANLALGAADAASPVAQTLSVQNVSSGTSNTSGANWTRDASRGTGTGSGGRHVWRTAPAGSSGSTQNALVEACAIESSGTFKLKTVTFSALPTAIANGEMIYVSDGAVTSVSDNTLTSGGTGALAVRINGAWRAFNTQN